MQASSLRIASYNIRKARGLDQRRRPGRTLDVINALDADVVVLQEADRRLGDRVAALPKSLIEANSDFDVAPIAKNDVSLGWHGNAILLRRGLVAKDIRHVELPGLEPRGAVRVTLGGATEVSVVATHLGLRRRDRRAQQAAICAAISEAEPVVIAGDFNEWSQDTGLETLETRFDVHAPGHSFHARRPVAALDRFALSDSVVLEDGGVDTSKLASRASDHLPIWGQVAVNTAAPAHHLT